MNGGHQAFVSNFWSFCKFETSAYKLFSFHRCLNSMPPKLSCVGVVWEWMSQTVG